MTMYVYHADGHPVGFLFSTFIHDLEGHPLGRVLGSHVYRLDGTYVGEFHKETVVQKPTAAATRDMDWPMTRAICSVSSRAPLRPPQLTDAWAP